MISVTQPRCVEISKESGTHFRYSPTIIRSPYTWWRHQMETFSALLAICTANSPHKGQWRGALMFSLICAWINGWVNNREAGDLRRYRTHCVVIVMSSANISSFQITIMFVPRQKCQSTSCWTLFICQTMKATKSWNLFLQNTFYSIPFKFHIMTNNKRKFVSEIISNLIWCYILDVVQFQFQWQFEKNPGIRWWYDHRSSHPAFWAW